jgi:peptidyl-prolyl cis-trans isomerase-like 2
MTRMLDPSPEVSLTSNVCIGYWMCPITNKALTNHSHVVAIKTTGNVYIYEAVNELNIKTRNFTDLITGEAFTRSDIITLQNPDDDEHMALRDINKFAHLQEEDLDKDQSSRSDSNIRFNPTAEKVMKEIEAKKQASEGSRANTLEGYLDAMRQDHNFIDDVKEILAMRPTIEDVNPGQLNTDGKASSSLTSTVMPSHTSNSTRLATAEEIREALCKKIRALGKKGYVQIQTSLGNLNLEIHCDVTPRTAWNFLSLCTNGYYNETIFHRLVTGFMVQGGDPTGQGSGGESLWKAPFKDEFDSRLTHDKRGIVSMANSGMNTNGSQFFIIFAPTAHLNLRHTIFGRVVGGAAVLDRIEAIGNDTKERPLEEIKVSAVEVFTNPVDEAMAICKEFVQENIRQRLERVNRTGLPPRPPPIGPASSSSSSVGVKRARDQDDAEVYDKPAIGKYLTTAATSSSSSSRQIGQTMIVKAVDSKGSGKPPKNDDKIAAFMKSQQSGLGSW